tara:strand:+ start:348 stop:596 length:249 start_codon:yes stop_codon:yes gene_type:complete
MKYGKGIIRTRAWLIIVIISEKSKKEKQVTNDEATPTLIQYFLKKIKYDFKSNFSFSCSLIKLYPDNKYSAFFSLTRKAMPM